MSAVGVTRLCDQLSQVGQPVTPHAVYHWLGGRADPRPAHARAIVQLSGGRVRLADIYSQRVVTSPPEIER